MRACWVCILSRYSYGRLAVNVRHKLVNVRVGLRGLREAVLYGRRWVRRLYVWNESLVILRSHGCEKFTQRPVHGHVQKFVIINVKEPVDATFEALVLGVPHGSNLPFLQRRVVVHGSLRTFSFRCRCLPYSDLLSMSLRELLPGVVEIWRILHLHEDVFDLHVVQMVLQPGSHVGWTTAEHHDRSANDLRGFVSHLAPALLLHPGERILIEVVGGTGKFGCLTRTKLCDRPSISVSKAYGT
mmetsp:Transcript_48001/g.104475  ORF Transcript_48001/g.104475 Transcript_48001/m.104475 type:complete len:242 (-) Transcript_48001:456-1181(-)